MANDSVRRQIIATITPKIKMQFTPRIMKDAGLAMAREYVRIVQERTMEGYGADGRRLKKLRPATIRRKTRLLLRGRVGRRKFRAQTPQDIARLTGQTLGDVEVRPSSVKVIESKSSIKVTFESSFKTERSEEIAGYLADGGRPINGLSPASTKRGKDERARLQAVADRRLGITSSRVSIK